MVERTRSLSRVQKIGVSIAALLLLCCGCLGMTSLLPTSEENIAAEVTSVVAEIDPDDTEEPTNTPFPPTDTPEPTNTPRPTNTRRPTNTPQPTHTPTNEPETAQITLETGEEIQGDLATVTRIIDGDTIEVEVNGRNYRVRYIGMDTPEQGEEFYSESTAANSQLVVGQTVILVKDVSETDRFGRLLRYVYLQDGTFVNAELVKQGYAQAATFPPDVAHQSDFTVLQREARDGGLGLWANAIVAAAPTNTPLPQPTNTVAAQPSNTPVPAQPTNAPIPQPTNTAAPPPTNTPAPQAAPGNVIISSIFFDGVVQRVESDEYAVIINQGGTAVNLGGWHLNADDAGQDFWFPAFDLQPGQSCRVYTNELHPETCGFSYNNGQALWANDGECGHLYDANGAEVSTYCY